MSLKISFQEALGVYKDLKLGSFVEPKSTNKQENNFKSAASILQTFGVTVKPEPLEKVRFV